MGEGRMSERRRDVIVASLIAALGLGAPAAAADSAGRLQGSALSASATSIELSSQARAQRPRIRVTPLPGPLRRECVAVFEERWIPQWGGLVLYPGQRCWWTRSPA
jgi:hypothetical protein